MVPEQRGSAPSGGADHSGRADEVDAAHAIPHLEFDESVPPRPEEEIADAARSARDDGVPARSS